jgi:hypothetical protein
MQVKAFAVEMQVQNALSVTNADANAVLLKIHVLEKPARFS